MNIFKIADSYLILKGSAVLPEERIRAQNLIFSNYYETNGATYKSFDAQRSLALGLELPQNEFISNPKSFRNELNNTKQQEKIKAQHPNDVFLYANFKVKDEDLHPVIRQIGMSVNNNCEVYKMRYDAASKSYISYNEKGKKCEINRTHAEVDSTSMTFYLRMYAFEKSDYIKIQKMYKQLTSLNVSEQRALLTRLSEKDRALFNAYRKVSKDVQKAATQKPYTLHHETCHIRFRFLMNKFNIAPDRKPISLEDYYRLNQYDEKIAHLAENLKAIRAYLTQRNPNDYSMFPEKSEWLVEKLKKVSPLQRKIMLNDNKMLVNGVNKYWDDNHQTGYAAQFFYQLDRVARKQPVSMIAKDNNDRSEYFKRLSALYGLQKYNPFTQKDELVDFSKLLEKEIPITPQLKNTLFAKVEQRLKARKDTLNQLGITRSVVAYVQKLHFSNNLAFKKPSQQKSGR